MLNLLQEGPVLSQQISKSPYDPICWHKRGALLLELGYPDLAMGDLYKCKLLCEDGLRTTTDNTYQAARRSSVQEVVLENISPTQSTSKSAKRNLSDMLDMLPVVIETLTALHESGSTQLIRTMVQARCFQDAIDLSQELSQQYTTNIDFLNLQDVAAHQLQTVARNSKLEGDAALMESRFGSAYRRIYPWMKEMHYKYV
jgi:hypothetical protein